MLSQQKFVFSFVFRELIYTIFIFWLKNSFGLKFGIDKKFCLYFACREFRQIINQSYADISTTRWKFGKIRIAIILSCIEIKMLINQNAMAEYWSQFVFHGIFTHQLSISIVERNEKIKSGNKTNYFNISVTYAQKNSCA